MSDANTLASHYYSVYCNIIFHFDFIIYLLWFCLAVIQESNLCVALEAQKAPCSMDADAR